MKCAKIQIRCMDLIKKFLTSRDKDWKRSQENGIVSSADVVWYQAIYADLEGGE